MQDGLGKFDFENVPTPMQGAADGMRALPPEKRVLVEESIKQIYSTPEGRELIDHAFDKNEQRPIRIIDWKDGFTIALQNGVISIGDFEANVQYQAVGTQEWVDLSVQRTVIHELAHLALDHELLVGDEDEYGMSETKEAQAITFANFFMRKYYDEAERYTDGTQISFEGTPAWDLNQNFDTTVKSEAFEKLKRALPPLVRDLPIETLFNASPELQSLREFSSYPDEFAKRIADLNDDGVNWRMLVQELYSLGLEYEAPSEEYILATNPSHNSKTFNSPVP